MVAVVVLVLSGVALLGSSPATAYQAPTAAFSGGTTTTPAGLQLTISSGGGTAGGGSGTIADRGYVASQFSPSVPSSTTAVALVVDATGLTATNPGTVYSNRGTISVTYEHPVRNPVLHLAGLGGAVVYNNGNQLATITGRMTLTTPGVTISKRSGPNLTVAGNLIRATNEDSSVFCNADNPSPWAGRSAYAGCGSVQVNGTVSSLTFSTSLMVTRLTGSNFNLQSGANDTFNLTSTMAEDFGDAPASYDGNNAARHVITDFALGSDVTQDNNEVANGTSSPNAGAGATGDADDALSDVPALAAGVAGRPYTLTVPYSGASKNGEVCGWIDFDKNGTFAAGERACAPAPSGGSSVDLTWTAPANLAAGTTYLRLRAGYTNAQVESPTGPSDSGEVEDYQVPIEEARGSIAGRAWSDTDRDGVQGAGESSLEGVTVELLDADGNVVGTTTTAADGSYRFDDLAMGDYKVRFTAPDGRTFSPANAGGDDTTDSDVDPATGETGTITLTGDAPEASHVDAGVLPPSPVANPDETSGPQGQPQSIDPLANDEAGDDSAPLDPDSLTLLDADGNPTDSVTVPGEGVYTVEDGKLVFTPEPQFTGTATPVDYQIADVNGTTARSTYTPTINPVTPTANPDETSGPQGQPQSIDPLTNDEAGDDAVPLDPSSLTLLDADGNPVDSVTVPGQGTYTVEDGKLVFTPEPGFVGTADPVDYQVADTNGTTTKSTYTPTVTPVAEPDETSGPQGQPQSVDPLANDGADGVELDPDTLSLVDEDGNPTDTVTVPGEGTYKVEDGKIVFTPEPQFTGEATPVKYQVKDTDGNPVESTYTPTVTPVTPTANPDQTSGPQGQPQSIDPLANDEAGDDSAPLDPSSLTLLDADGNPTDSVTVPGQGTYTVEDGKLVFTPEPQFTGTADPVDYQVADTNGTTATSTYTPTINPVTPTANPDETSGPQGVPQSIDPLSNDEAGDDSAPLDPSSLTLLDADGNPVSSVTIDGQGTYTVEDGKLVFTPEPQFTGTADPVDYRIADTNGTTATSTYTPTINPVTPTASPDVSSGPQGQPQSVDPLTNDEAGDPDVPLDPDSLTLLDADGNPTETVTVPGEGTYTVEDGKLVFTPEPGFTGTATPVDYRVSDVNGTPTDSTYTPTVGTVANPDVTSGPQGQPQSVDPLANDGADGVELDPDTLSLVDEDGNPTDTVTVPGEGTYKVEDGKIVFTPEPQFTGEATPVKYQVKDTDGNPVESTYTPTVTPVTPTANPDQTSGPQGQPQSIDPLTNDEAGDDDVPLDPDSLTLLDEDGNPVDSVTSPGEGVYTVEDGKIVFTPEPQFTGTATPVDYQVADTNGTTAKSTYTPTITPVTPTANPDETSGPQGQPQSIDPLTNDEAGDDSAPLDPSSLTLLDEDGNPTDSVIIPGEGTYTVEDGKLVFTPEPQFTGTATPVDYQVADTNGTTAKSTYTPTINPVTPTANPDETSGPQGVPQSIDPLTNDEAGDDSAPLDPDSLTLLDADGNPTDSVTVPGQGTYTVEDGKLVFTPEPQFTGTATPVDYQVADTNGTTAKSTYTPTIEPVSPTANPDETSGPQGAKQSVDPLANDEAGDPDVPLDPDSLTLLDADGNPTDTVTVPGQGTYTVEDGKLVFTPEPGFVGTADPVDYQVADVNGTTTKSTYTPTVTPVAQPDETSGPQGVPQSIDPLANDGADGVELDPDTLTLVDEDGNPTDTVTVPGEGVYKVEDGKIVFTPEPGFTGEATPVRYQVKDTDGNPVESTYTPTVTPVTPTANPDETSGPQGQPQSVDPLTNDEAGDDAVPLDPDSLTLLDADGNPTDSVTVPGEGTYTVEDGKLVFTPEPQFTGTATPVDYQVADTNGTTAKSTYTPTINPVTPTANPDETSGPQGVPQSIDPLTNDEAGDDSAPLDPDSLTLLDEDGNPTDSVTIPGEGTYTVQDGKLVFTPEPQFTGTATPVEYQVADTNGTTAKSTYTPTIEPVTPTANPDETSGPQGAKQSVDPLANDEAGDDDVPLDPDSLTLLDEDGNPVDSVTMPGEGTYT
ncbi:Ig-like domain-containing protein, partial [Pimelobacter simplex]|uniref:Ig-like domain-containing protein n=1 Tax=Nocardioides simplex TaxID=2045 RepID=UPI0037F91F80